VLFYLIASLNLVIDYFVAGKYPGLVAFDIIFVDFALMDMTLLSFQMLG
jgi:hypothetical protein